MNESLDEHYELIRALSRPGGPLAPDAPTATINLPDYFVGSEVRARRAQLHSAILERHGERHDSAVDGWRALLLAGVPGAGKSSVRDAAMGDRSRWVEIDPDWFKVQLLAAALSDGDYDRLIVPDRVREWAEQGHRVFPMELASLVHEESSYLAREAQRSAMESGRNLVIDGVLGDRDKALARANSFADAGYQIEVHVIDVPEDVAAARVRSRWMGEYEKALSGESELGGRWVPSEYMHGLYLPDGSSAPVHAARHVSRECAAVTKRVEYRVDAIDGAPQETGQWTRAHLAGGAGHPLGRFDPGRRRDPRMFQGGVTRDDPREL